MIDFNKIKTIDFHTHAEEPCCGHRDDGYNEFQSGIAAYFKNPAGMEGMLPTVEKTAVYYREDNMAAVIFPVDAERKTEFRRYVRFSAHQRGLKVLNWVCRYLADTATFVNTEWNKSGVMHASRQSMKGLRVSMRKISPQECCTLKKEVMPFLN